MGELSDIVKKRSPFLRLEGGESLIGAYKGFKMIPSTYDPEKEIFRFLIEVTTDEGKQTKYWDTGSNKVAIVFDTLKPGSLVKITKSVLTKNGKESTSWEVVPVADDKGEVTVKEAEEAEKEMAG